MFGIRMNLYFVLYLFFIRTIVIKFFDFFSLEVSLF